MGQGKPKSAKAMFLEEFEKDINQERFRKALGGARSYDKWFQCSRLWFKRSDVDWMKVPYDAMIISFMDAARNALMVDGDECMVMIRGQKNPQCRCEIGYKGVIRKAGDADIKITTAVFKEGDDFDADEGAGTFRLKPAWMMGAKQGATLGFVAKGSYPDGTSVIRLLSAEAAKERAPAHSHIWKDHFDEMGRKSAILSLRKVLYFGDDIEDALKALKLHDPFDDGEDPKPAEGSEQEAARPARQSTKERVQAAADDAEDPPTYEGPYGSPDDSIDPEDLF